MSKQDNLIKKDIADKDMIDESKADPETKAKKKKKKNNKQTAVPLDQFLAPKTNGDLSPDLKENLIQGGDLAKERNFFKQVEKEAERIIRHEIKVKDGESKGKRDKGEEVRTLQYQEELRKRNNEVIEVKKELDKVRDELEIVKKRNRRLCKIIGSGESEFSN